MNKDIWVMFISTLLLLLALSTAAPFLPGTKESWEGVGIQPDHLVEESDALGKAVKLT